MTELLWLTIPCLYYLISLFVYRFGDREVFDSKLKAIIFSLLWPVWFAMVITAMGLIIFVAVVLIAVAIIRLPFSSNHTPENIKTGTPF